MVTIKNKRPVFLNLFQIRLPVSGVVSILHRISGVLLFLVIPVSLWLLDSSLGSEAQFQEITDIFHRPLIVAVVALLIWSLLHHLFTGIRHLLLDLDIGVDKSTSTKTSWVVMLSAPVLTMLLLLRIYL